MAISRSLQRHPVEVEQIPTSPRIARPWDGCLWRLVDQPDVGGVQALETHQRLRQGWEIRGQGGSLGFLRLPKVQRLRRSDLGSGATIFGINLLPSHSEVGREWPLTRPKRIESL